MADISTQLTGKVIGYSVRFVPAQQSSSKGWSESYKAKMGAFVNVEPLDYDEEGKQIPAKQDDGRDRLPIHIPCRAVELVYDKRRLKAIGVQEAGELTPQLLDADRIDVYQDLQDQLPLNTLLTFHERTRVVKRGKRSVTHRKYALKE